MRRRRSNTLRSTSSAGASRSRSAGDASPVDTAEAVALLDDVRIAARELSELEEFMTSERPMRRDDVAFRERLRLDLWWGLMVQRAGGPDRLPQA